MTDFAFGNGESFAHTIKTTIRDAMKMKKIMLAKSLRRARAICPECGGMLHAVLAGRKNHIRMICDGSCKRQIME